MGQYASPSIGLSIMLKSSLRCTGVDQSQEEVAFDDLGIGLPSLSNKLFERVGKHEIVRFENANINPRAAAIPWFIESP